LDLETGQESQLPSLRSDWMPTLAPDGSKVVFVSDRWGTSHDLWVQDLEGSMPAGSARRLTKQSGDAAFPVFSPDGEWMAYYRILEGRRDIMTLSVNGGWTHQITEDPADDVQPTWAPNGSRLAFASMRERSGTWQIWTVAVEDGRRVGAPQQLTFGGASANGPAWSPDGELVAFLGHQGNQNDAFVVGLEDGSAPQRITRNARATSVGWDPATGDVLVAGRFGKEQETVRRFSRTGQEIGSTRFPVIFGGKSGYTRFAVSVDGRMIVYTRQRLTGDVWLLESVEQPY
jgi:TolB protein